MNLLREKAVLPADSSWSGGLPERRKFPLEQRALACALLAAMLSLGGTWLAAMPIERASASSVGAVPQPAPAAAFMPSPQLAAMGAGFFGQSCGDCHGDDAHGDEGPDLHNLALSNARIATTIRGGIKGEMPSFAEKYDDPQIAALVAYLRTLK
jgi:mono/diheme cytochrome c family protein